MIKRFTVLLFSFLFVGCGVEEVVLEARVSSPHVLIKSVVLDKGDVELELGGSSRFGSDELIEDINEEDINEDDSFLEEVVESEREDDVAEDSGTEFQEDKKQSTDEKVPASNKEKVMVAEKNFSPDPIPEKKEKQEVASAPAPAPAVVGNGRASGEFRTLWLFDSDVHVYVSGSGERLAVANGGHGAYLRPLSKIVLPNEVAKMNLGFFGGEVRHIGMHLVDGLYTSAPDGRFVDLHYYKDGRIGIGNYGSDLEWAVVEQLKAETHFVVGTSYSLVQDGVLNLQNAEHFSHSKERRPRSLFGQRRDGRFLFVVVDGGVGSSGVTAQQSAQIMLDLGSYQAVNFDGGGSSTLIVDGVLRNRPANNGVERNIGSAMFLVR